MLSAANLAALDTAGCRFIVGSRLTKAPIDLESHFRWHGDYFGDGQVIDTLTPKAGRKATTTRPCSPNRCGTPGAPRVVAGGVGILPQPRRPGHQDPDRPGEPRPRRHHRRQSRPHAPVRQDRQATGSCSTRPRSPAPGSLAGLKGYVTNITAAADARHRGDRQLSRPVARRAVLPHVQDRPRRQAHVRPHPRRHRSPPDHRVHRARHLPHRPEPHRQPIRRSYGNLRPLRRATIEINGASRPSRPSSATATARSSRL